MLVVEKSRLRSLTGPCLAHLAEGKGSPVGVPVVTEESSPQEYD
jgi:hypothetical protein